MADFGDQLRAFANKTDKRTNALVKKLVFDISTKLVLRSPVGDPSYWISKPPPGYVGGRFRANWQYGLDHINTSTTETIDKSGQSTMSRFRTSVPANAVGHVHYLTNSLPYGPRLENGWSRQAPHGMVRLTAQEYQQTVRKLVAQLT